MTMKRTKKTSSKPNKQAAKKANSKKTGAHHPKAQTTKKAKTSTGKASSTTVKPNKTGSEPKVQPTQQARTSAEKASSTAKRTSTPKVQPTPKAEITTAIASSKKKKNSPAKKLVSEPKVNRNPGRNANSDRKASTVKAAFKKFQSKMVDLDRATTEKGRASRDYLFNLVKQIVDNPSDFPPLKGDYISFGSFARKTKIRPLDDIDLLLLLNGRGIDIEFSYRQKASGYGVNMTAVCRVKITDERSPLQGFADNKGYVNSIKILNRIKYHLASVPNYQKAAKNRRMQAVTLNLKSHPWIFDIVPAIPIHDYQDKVTHFLIPDGYGNWIRTNPKIDAQSLTSVNAKHKGELLPVLRLLKYWNKRKHKPGLSSYYFETLVVQTFQYAPEITSYPAALEYFFHYCSSYIMSSCPDPKKLGEALDANVSWDTKQKIITALKNAASHASHAMMAESKNDQKTAIYWWKKVFGSEFPDYG